MRALLNLAISATLLAAAAMAQAGCAHYYPMSAS
jgi:hypothetical protein